MSDYRYHGATRKKNPPAKIAAEGTVAATPKIEYAYSPHLSAVLRFDPAARPDTLPAPVDCPGVGGGRGGRDPRVGRMTR